VSDHYLTWPEFLLLGSMLAFPALLATVVVTVWYLRRRLRLPVTRSSTAVAALGAVTAAFALSLLLWPLMNPLWSRVEELGIDFRGLEIVVLLLHPPAPAAAATVLALGRVAVRFSRRAGQAPGV
jgi:hypothetical protein